LRQRKKSEKLELGLRKVKDLVHFAASGFLDECLAVQHVSEAGFGLTRALSSVSVCVLPWIGSRVEFEGFSSLEEHSHSTQQSFTHAF
jgi:hypothetical protein